MDGYDIGFLVFVTTVVLSFSGFLAYLNFSDPDWGNSVVGDKGKIFITHDGVVCERRLKEGPNHVLTNCSDNITRQSATNFQILER